MGDMDNELSKQNLLNLCKVCQTTVTLHGELDKAKGEGRFSGMKKNIKMTLSKDRNTLMG